MAKFKIHFDLMQQQTEEIQAVQKLIDSHAQTLEDISAKLENDSALAGIKSALKNGAGQMQELAQSIAAMAEIIDACIQSYTKTENDSVSKVDNTRAHNRDFYKHPVAVPSPGGVGGGAGAAAGPAAVNIQANTTTVSATYVDASTMAPAAAPEIVRTAAAAGASPSFGSAPAGASSSPGGISGVAAGLTAAGIAGATGVGATVMANKKNKAAQADGIPSDA